MQSLVGRGITTPIVRPSPVRATRQTRSYPRSKNILHFPKPADAGGGIKPPLKKLAPPMNNGNKGKRETDKTKELMETLETLVRKLLRVEAKTIHDFAIQYLRTCASDIRKAMFIIDPKWSNPHKAMFVVLELMERFAERVYDPETLSAVRKNIKILKRGIALIHGAPLIPLPRPTKNMKPIFL